MTGNNIDPYTGIRHKCFTLRKNQFSLLVKCHNNTGIGVFAKQCLGGVFGNLVLKIRIKLLLFMILQQVKKMLFASQETVKV
jgi:hypothetical protein